VGNAAIIVDPSSMQIISKAADQIHQHDASLKRNTCVRVESDGASSLAETTEDNDRKFLLSSSHVRNDLKMEVSCINLWGWTKQRSSEQKRLPSEGGFLWHPLRHAAIVAIENAAERDKMLFHTSTSSTTKLKLKGDMQVCSDNPPVNWPKVVAKARLVTYLASIVFFLFRNGSCLLLLPLSFHNLWTLAAVIVD
jgi:tRNA-specific adenosine deaminase 3